MRNWTRKKGHDGNPRFVSSMDRTEVDLVRRLISSMIELLDERSDTEPHDELAELTGLRTGHSTPPDNGSLARLLPDFYEASFKATEAANNAEQQFATELNGALRSLNEPEIIDAKRAAATTVLQTLPTRSGSISLTGPEAEQWLTAINDIRLALGVMLGITAEHPDSEPTADSRRSAHVDVYHWLSALVDLLVSELLR